MNALITLMITGIIVGAVLPYHAPKYVVQANPTPVISMQEPVVSMQTPALGTGGPEPSQSTVKASWYGVHEYCDLYNPKCNMANGAKLDDEAFTAACGSRWKLGDMVAVIYQKKTVIVTCTDRGSFEGKYGRALLDLSKAAFSALAPLSRGVIEVEIL